MFSAFGFTWIVHLDGSQFLNDTPHMIRDRYLYKWLLVEHQRLCLLALATECADMSKVSNLLRALILPSNTKDENLEE